MAIDENSFVRRVLIYRLGSLGDTIVSLPSLHLVARAFPQAERRLLTNFPVETKAAAAQTILDGTGLIHDYFSYAVGLRHFNKLLDLRKAIREWQPDVVVYLMPGRGIRNARRDAVFFRSCGITRLIGMPLSLDKQRHRKRAANSLYESEAARLARCVAELGDARLDDPASWDMRLNVHENNAAETALVPAGKRPIIACSLGTKVQAKDCGAWTTGACSSGGWRRSIPGFALVMMGAGSEFDASSYAADGWSSVSGAGPVINLCGQLQPRESAAVLAAREDIPGARQRPHASGGHGPDADGEHIRSAHQAGHLVPARRPACCHLPSGVLLRLRAGLVHSPAAPVLDQHLGERSAGAGEAHPAAYASCNLFDQRQREVKNSRMLPNVETILNLLEGGFSRLKILVVGDLMLDRYIHGDVNRISPEAPVPVLRHATRTERAGGAANVAMNLAGLGVKCYLAGYWGRDAEATRAQVHRGSRRRGHGSGAGMRAADDFEDAHRGAQPAAHPVGCGHESTPQRDRGSGAVRAHLGYRAADGRHHPERL